jgi:hypothetical protein
MSITKEIIKKVIEFRVIVESGEIFYSQSNEP